MCKLRIWIFTLWVLSASGCGAETITIAAEDAWYPFSGMNNGKIEGYSVDVVRAAFAAVKIDVKFEPIPYARCLHLVKTGQLLGCFNTTRTSLMEPDYLWTRKPMFTITPTIYSRSDSKERDLTISDLEGKRVIVTYEYEYGEAFDTDKKIIRDESPTDVSAFRKLLAGRADYVISYGKITAYLLRNYSREFSGKIVAVGNLNIKEDVYTVFSKTYPDSARYMELYNQGFDIISKNRTLATIEKKWN